MKRVAFLLLFAFGVALLPQRPASSLAAEPEQVKAYPQTIRPLLQTYCIKCHNDDTQEGGVNYANLRTEGEALTKRSLWKRARARIDAGEMPPEEAKPLTASDRKQLSEWMAFAAQYVDCDPARRTPIPTPLRRLTRAEYDRTIHDLFDFDFDSGLMVGMPSDENGEQFANLANNLTLSSSLMEKYFASADKVIETLFGSDWRGQGGRRKLFFVQPNAQRSEAETAKQIVTRLLRRAFRRPPDAEDLARYLRFYEQARARGASFENGIRAVVKPVLVSTQFLYRLERASGTPNDHELAVRLSYFLWSSMPDDALFAAAEAGTLHTPAELEKQVKRMLTDPKGKSLTDQFAMQWLQLGKLAKARPTTEFFPTFQANLKQAMGQEVTSFFDDLRVNNGRMTDLLDANYTFVNETLATHYGIENVKGDKMQRVTLEPRHHRGGLLGMAAILTLTSHTFRTSPTQRGKYVLEVIFGTPPPPPPPNAGTIKDDQAQGKAAVTFREQLAQHASQPSCAGCHRKIDPLGFALDNYNAIGAWRESTKTSPLDTTGILPGGEKVDGVAALKQVIVRRQEEFAHNVAEKMLVYALGRELQLSDECTVRDIVKAWQPNEYRLHSLVQAIATRLSQE